MGKVAEKLLSAKKVLVPNRLQQVELSDFERGVYNDALSKEFKIGTGTQMKKLPEAVIKSARGFIQSSSDLNAFILQLLGIGDKDLTFSTKYIASGKRRYRTDLHVDPKKNPRLWKAVELSKKTAGEEYEIKKWQREIKYTLYLVGFKDDGHLKKMLKDVYTELPRKEDFKKIHDKQNAERNIKEEGKEIAWFKGWGWQELPQDFLESISQDDQAKELVHPSRLKKLGRAVTPRHPGGGGLGIIAKGGWFIARGGLREQPENRVRTEFVATVKLVLAISK